MCTDYCPEIKLDNNFKSFLKMVKDILISWDAIAKNTDSNKTLPADLKLKHYFTYYHVNTDSDNIIEEYSFFV